jgi:hypothetical protein
MASRGFILTLDTGEANGFSVNAITTQVSQISPELLSLDQLEESQLEIEDLHVGFLFHQRLCKGYINVICCS